MVKHILTVLTFAMLWLAHCVAKGGDTTRSIAIHTSKNNYAIGEPIAIEVTFTNISTKDVCVPEVLAEGYESEIPIFINGKRFKFGYPPACVVVKPRPLKAGESWKYRVCLGYGYSEKEELPVRKHLPFDKPGTYEIKTGWPPVAYDGSEPYSNILHIRVKEPVGIDARAWQNLHKIESVFEWLQWHQGPPRKTAVRFMELLEEFPDTGYSSALRRALRRSYFHRRPELALDERARIRRLTGVTDVYDFPDKRLQTKVELRIDPAKVKSHDSSAEIKLGDLLEMLTRQTGVPLDASPYLKRRTTAVWTQTVPGWGVKPTDLRGYMDQEFVTDRLNASWHRRGDGYVLLEDEEIEASLSAAKKAGAPK